MNDPSDKELHEATAKIRKVMALAERAGTEAEAATAVEMVQVLLAKYNLSLGDVKAEDPHATVTDEQCFVRGIRNDSWARDLWAAVGTLYFCKYFSSTRRAIDPAGTTKTRGIMHHLVGKRHNVVVAREMAEYLVDTVIKLSRHAFRDEGRRKSFRIGAQERLSQRIYGMIERAKAGIQQDGTGSSNLPALGNLYAGAQAEAEGYISKVLSIELCSRPRRQRKIDMDGYIAGHTAGDTISLDTQMGESTSRRKLLAAS